jgi:hypothetical protein
MPNVLFVHPPVFRSAPVLVADGDDGTLIHPASGLRYRLNCTGRYLWEALREPTTLDALEARLGTEFDVEPAVASGTVAGFVHQLAELGFVELRTDDDGRSELRRRYLALLEKALVNLVYPEHELRLRHAEAADPGGDPGVLQRALRDIRYADPTSFAELVAGKQDGRNFRLSVTRDAHTMVGLRRLDNIEWCAAQVFAAGVEGDFLEAGVCQGGAAIFLRGVQVAYDQAHRRTWVADSFEGLPPPRDERDDGLDLTEARRPWLAATRQAVEDNFRTYDLLSDAVCFVPGWFADSLPSCPVERIALLRVDADLHSSTLDVLTALWDRVVVGGFVIVDDYHAFRSCRAAVDGFRADRGITDPLRRVDWTAVYWQRTA